MGFLQKCPLLYNFNDIFDINFVGSEATGNYMGAIYFCVCVNHSIKGTWYLVKKVGFKGKASALKFNIWMRIISKTILMKNRFTHKFIPSQGK